MRHLLKSTGAPFGLLGVFVLFIAAICAPAIGYAGQLKPASSSDAQSVTLHQETGTAQTSHASQEIPSCTPPRPDGQEGTQGDKQPLHTVYLSWKASASPDVTGYNVYRGETLEKLDPINSDPIAATNCVDSSVEPGKTYYYVVKAANKSHLQSGPSNVASASIPPR